MVAQHLFLLYFLTAQQVNNVNKVQKVNEVRIDKTWVSIDYFKILIVIFIAPAVKQSASSLCHSLVPYTYGEL